jgi:C4-dicarboxylate-specific signal transduction histidine kinase
LEKAYQDLQSAQQELIKSERLTTLGKFASMVLHDLRNPISILKGYAEMIVLTPG